MGAQPKSLQSVTTVLLALEEDIVLGRLYPRERLVEEQLALRFGIKRHVVRQVLSGLEAAGLIVRQGGKGAMVREYSAEDVMQLYQMREIVEGQAAAMIDLPIAETDFDRLEKICDDYADAIEQTNMRGVIENNKRFHREVYRLCGNDFLADVIDNMGQKANLVRFSSTSDPKYLAQARDEHFGILQALKGTDNALLAKLCVDHMQPSRRIYLEKMARMK
ncbi:MAG: GntR family transcriptional regulator [Rhizobiaceae bacterium]|nr:GntR family transcriptional regulator [Rhizobiaceae bacterium]